MKILFRSRLVDIVWWSKYDADWGIDWDTGAWHLGRLSFYLWFL